MTKFFFGNVLSTKLGWKWIKSEYSSHINHILDLRTVNQIFEIQRLSKEAIPTIDNFEKQLEGLTTEIRLNFASKKRQNSIEGTGEHELLKRMPVNIRQMPLSNNSSTILNMADAKQPNKIFNPYEEIVKFEANLDLPKNWLVDNDGYSYQVIPGLPVSILKRVAREFEQKGFGRIVS